MAKTGWQAQLKKARLAGMDPGERQQEVEDEEDEYEEEEEEDYEYEDEDEYEYEYVGNAEAGFRPRYSSLRRRQEASRRRRRRKRPAKDVVRVKRKRRRRTVEEESRRDYKDDPILEMLLDDPRGETRAPAAPELMVAAVVRSGLKTAVGGGVLAAGRALWVLGEEWVKKGVRRY